MTECPEERSKVMRAVKGWDTEPEMTVRRLTHGMGDRYRLQCKDLPGKPDLAFPTRRKAIFVHGCFWHAHGCRYGRIPKSRLDYWLPKLKQNKKRDAQKNAQLEMLGGQVLTVWQCEIKDLDALTDSLCTFLEGGPVSSKVMQGLESQ